MSIKHSIDKLSSPTYCDCCNFPLPSQQFSPWDTSFYYFYYYLLCPLGLPGSAIWILSSFLKDYLEEQENAHDRYISLAFRLCWRLCLTSLVCFQSISYFRMQTDFNQVYSNLTINYIQLGIHEIIVVCLLQLTNFSKIPFHSMLLLGLCKEKKKPKKLQGKENFREARYLDGNSDVMVTWLYHLSQL